jgi:hypothetical protein
MFEIGGIPTSPFAVVVDESEQATAVVRQGQNTAVIAHSSSGALSTDWKGAV